MTQKTVHEFGRYIRHQRTEAGVSLRYAAKALGVSAVYLGEVERGVRPPLKEAHWEALVCVIPTIEKQTLARLTAQAKPIQLDLRGAPPDYQDLGLALARRIERKNISVTDLKKLFSILGKEDE